jgi:CHAD domain-containing protein
MRCCALLRTLQADQAASRRWLRESPAQLMQTRAALERLCGRVSHWPVGSHGWSVVGPALARIYQGGRRTWPRAMRRPTDSALHEWRQQVKYLRYALEILAPIRPRKLARLARQAKQLTDGLGTAHDMAILAQRAQLFRKHNRAALASLFATIERRRNRLNLDALSRGHKSIDPSRKVGSGR